MNSFLLTLESRHPDDVPAFKKNMSARCESAPMKLKPLFITVNLLFVSGRVKNRLVLVAAAGSATTGPLELPALGADVGPGGEIKTRQ